MKRSKITSDLPKDIIIGTHVSSPFLAEASLTAIAVSEGPAHVLQYVNPAFCRLYGRTAPEFLGRPFPEVIRDRGTADAAPLLDRVFRGAEAEYLTDEAASDDSVPGSRGASWHYTVWPLLDQTGHPIGLVTQVSNVAAHVPSADEAYVVMRTANQQLLLAALREGERSETLVLADRAKDEFLAMLAHELRNPLAAIRTGVYLVSQHAGRAAAEIHQECDLIERQIRHLARLLDDLLDVSRITQGKINLRMERIDIVPVAQHAIRTIQPLADATPHELSVDLPSEPVWVDADPDRMEQVIVNLLHNAVKYTNPGGRIWLRVGTQQNAADGGAPSAGDGDAVIRVRDTGIGISPENLSNIFDLFVQTDRSFDRSQGGLGIGLTLVRRMIEMHGGSVVAESDGIGRGSEFVVRLPLQKAVENPFAFPEEAVAPGTRTKAP
ncbi:MAG TPA: ATP-binding protein, partial [Armatimonadota bacterium]|nr:ATP-binding protein [Armatimonadota bacterium]